jgi:hypothetical protein
MGPKIEDAVRQILQLGDAEPITPGVVDLLDRTETMLAPYGLELPLACLATVLSVAGERVRQNVPDATGAGWCAACGVENGESSKFCSSCGGSLQAKLSPVVGGHAIGQAAPAPAAVGQKPEPGMVTAQSPTNWREVAAGSQVKFPTGVGGYAVGSYLGVSPKTGALMIRLFNGSETEVDAFNAQVT